MAALIYFIIFISNLININTQKDFYISNIIKMILPDNIYNQILKNYDINIQIIENKNITNEFYINATYIKKGKPFDLYYIGKLFFLNDNNLDLLSDKKYENPFVLLINSNNTLIDYIYNNRSLIKYLTKIIIVPKNKIPMFHIISYYYSSKMSIHLLELEENIFNQIINIYNKNYNNSQFYVKILSKKFKVFPFKILFLILIIFSFILMTFSLIYKFAIQSFENYLKERQISFLKDLSYLINEKVLIFFLIFIEFNIFYRNEGFFNTYPSFISIVTLVIMIINKARNNYFILTIFSGRGLIFKDSMIFKVLNYYLTAFIISCDILFPIFISPSIIPFGFYFLNIFIYTPTFIVIIFYSIKNFIFLLRVILKIKKSKRYNNIYGGAIRSKICIVIFQLFFYLIYIYLFFILHSYLLFKKNNYFEIERVILFQCLDSFIIMSISLIYIPRKWPRGFDLYILLINEGKKTNKAQIFSGRNYKSNIPKESFINKKEIKKFIINNRQKHFSILNPIVFLNKEKKNKDIGLLEKNIKIGKLSTT